MTRRVRIVLDTKVLISAFMWRNSKPFHVFKFALDGRCLNLTCDPIMAEMHRVLTQKFKVEKQAIGDAVHAVRRMSRLVVPKSLPLPMVRDPDDQIVLSCAITGNAKYLVSGDKDLVSVGHFGSVQIVTPAQIFRSHGAGR